MVKRSITAIVWNAEGGGGINCEGVWGSLWNDENVYHDRMIMTGYEFIKIDQVLKTSSYFDLNKILSKKNSEGF